MTARGERPQSLTDPNATLHIDKNSKSNTRPQFGQLLDVEFGAKDARESLVGNARRRSCHWQIGTGTDKNYVLYRDVALCNLLRDTEELTLEWSSEWHFNHCLDATCTDYTNSPNGVLISVPADTPVLRRHDLQPFVLAVNTAQFGIHYFAAHDGVLTVGNVGAIGRQFEGYSIFCALQPPKFSTDRAGYVWMSISSQDVCIADRFPNPHCQICPTPLSDANLARVFAKQLPVCLKSRRFEQLVIDCAIIFYRLPPYVLLEIVDWLPGARQYLHHIKVELIISIKRACTAVK